MESGIVRTSVIALGREGVWRLKNLDFASSDEDVRAHIDNPFLQQPEESDEYALIELQIGMPTLTTLDSVPHNTFSKNTGDKNLLAACNVHGESVPFSDIKFKVEGIILL